MNSSIVRKKKYGEHVVAGLSYAFGSQGAGGRGDVGNGGSTPGDFKKGSTQAASIALNSIDIGGGLLSAYLSYDRANVNGLIHRSELIGGDHRIGMFRVNAGYIHYTAEQGLANSLGTRTDDAWTVSMSLLPTPENEIAVGFNDSKDRRALQVLTRPRRGETASARHLCVVPMLSLPRRCVRPIQASFWR